MYAGSFHDSLTCTVIIFGGWRRRNETWSIPPVVCLLRQKESDAMAGEWNGHINLFHQFRFPLTASLCLCMLQNPKVRDALKQEFPSYDVVEFLGTGPILEQLKTFATASLIVAPHGAGLSNMVVSPLHTPVLEIGPLGCSPCYVHLAMKVNRE